MGILKALVLTLELLSQDVSSSEEESLEVSAFFDVQETAPEAISEATLEATPEATPEEASDETSEETLKDIVPSVPEDICVVTTADEAKRIVHLLRTKYKDMCFACDTEVSCPLTVRMQG